MSESTSHLRRLASSAGLYALAGVAQQAVGFLLIPIYTRVIEPGAYGALEILNAFSAILFASLTIGLASAINKCYHRDCNDAGERAAILPTALAVDVPILLLGAGLLLLGAEPISHWVVGVPGNAHLLRIVVCSGVLFGLDALVLASLRAQERAVAFCVLSALQFGSALALNLLFVVGLGWGVEGILIGNLIANAAVLPAALFVARPSDWRPRWDLAAPLLRFGLLLVPVMLAGWVMNVSDRYILGLFHDLEEVGVYGVGYKFGMLIELAVVWPFQLAWPAFAFAISERADHGETYAHTLTYLTLVLTTAVLGLSLATRALLPGLVGEAYADAYRLVPIIAFAYACNGVQYCVAPGLHVAGRTVVATGIAVAAALLNLLLSLLLIPWLGMMGAAWATAGGFAFLAGATAIAAQRVHPVPYEYGRLIKILAAGAAAFAIGHAVSPASPLAAAAWCLLVALVGFPVLLLALGFADERERGAAARLFRRAVPALGSR